MLMRKSFSQLILPKQSDGAEALWYEPACAFCQCECVNKDLSVQSMQMYEQDAKGQK